MAITYQQAQDAVRKAEEVQNLIGELYEAADGPLGVDEAELANAGSRMCGVVDVLRAVLRRHRPAVSAAVVAALLLIGLLPTRAQAQQCVFTPYVPDTFTERCSLNPYQTERRPNGGLVPTRVCASDALLTAPAVKLGISEGQMGTPDHERGYIVVSNASIEAQDAIVEIMLRGNNTTTFIKRLHLEPLTSQTIDLIGHPLFQCEPRFFNTIVYGSHELTAEMLIYALRDAAHPLAYLTTDKDGLPISGGTR